MRHPSCQEEAISSVRSIPSGGSEVACRRVLAWAGTLLATLLLAGLAGFGCSTSTADAATQTLEPPVVRILVEQRAGRVMLTATRSPVLDGQPLEGPLRLNLPDVPVAISLTSGGWRIGREVFERGELTLIPAEDGSVALNGNRYRGRLRFVPVGEDVFDVVNDLDVESYLMGVLPRELPPDWHLETYKAQAVIARTYALFELRTAGRGRGHFDLFTDDRSQVYGGMNAETPISRDAVRATRGQVAVHQTPAGLRIFKAYFHSTSGGVTISAADAFKDAPSQALSAQSLGDAGSASSRWRWDPVVLPKDELTRRIRAWGQRRNHTIGRIGPVDRIEIASANDYGRPTRFEVVDSRGTRYSLTAEEMRWAINSDPRGGPTVFSGFFRPINNQHNIVLSEGRGWGHGVGMCQWTAQGWARQGKRYIQIVTDSYPDTQVVRAY